MKIHHGHQGIQRCRLRVSTSVWWPGVAKQMDEYIRQCPTCVRMTHQPCEPLLPTPLPKHPWEKIATDLFERKEKHFLVLVDYYSRYLEVIQLTSTTSSSVISAMKSIFCRHGIPQYHSERQRTTILFSRDEEIHNSVWIQTNKQQPIFPTK